MNKNMDQLNQPPRTTDSGLILPKGRVPLESIDDPFNAKTANRLATIAIPTDLPGIEIKFEIGAFFEDNQIELWGNPKNVRAVGTLRGNDIEDLLATDDDLYALVEQQLRHQNVVDHDDWVTRAEDDYADEDCC